jgi:hypothetical protein
MNYYFKKIPISTITDSGNTTNQNFFNSFPTQSTSYTGLRPLPLSYTIPTNGDISNICKASTVKYNASTNITAPPGANYFRAITVGGKGGTGGKGGDAKLTIIFGPNETFNGGAGGNGGNGNIYYYDSFNNVNINSKNISITIGTQGNTGNNGNNYDKTETSKNGITGVGSPGGPGGQGNSSFINISGIQYAIANGGGGGGGGNGADIRYNIPSQIEGSKGNTGNTGSGGGVTNNTGLNFPTSTDSSVTIIWLYD